MGLIDRLRLAFTPTMRVSYEFSDSPSNVLNYDAIRLYTTQDNLQAVINFRANAIAQLPLKVYSRNGETERDRDRDSVAAKLLYKPNDYQTQFELIYGTLIEWDIFGSVYWLVTPSADTESGYEIHIIPSHWVVKKESKDAYGSSAIYVRQRNGGETVKIPKEYYINFSLYAPGNPGGFMSPISALRQTLLEQIEAAGFRRKLWKSSGRLNAQIVRPKDVQPWDETTRDKWIEAFRAAWGAGGSNEGKIPLMEDGMEIKPFQTSFREQQWAESVKLNRETCAAAYQMNPSMIWHSDSQTYASAKDNARALYSDSLGPLIQRLQQRINAFLFPMIGASSKTYCEFDMQEKLRGSFEETASIMQSAVGGPWLTRNEARARMNLPPLAGGDELIVPLNVITGGQASPNDTHMDAQEPMTTVEVQEQGEKCSCGCHVKEAKTDGEIRFKGRASKEEDESVSAILTAFFNRQMKSVLPKVGASEDWWNEDRWNDELTADLVPVINAIADSHGKAAADVLGSEYIPEKTRAYLEAMCNGRATAINSSTKKKLESAIEDEEDIELSTVFEKRAGVDALTIGASLATITSSWSTVEAVQQAESQPGYTYKSVEKVWITGENARESHQLMNGESVPVEATFSNGLFWPGDDSADPSETCGCNCTTEIVVRRS